MGGSDVGESLSDFGPPNIGEAVVGTTTGGAVVVSIVGESVLVDGGPREFMVVGGEDAVTGRCV